MHPEEAVPKSCNNSAEYSGHSDPTFGFSTPKTEFRSLGPDDMDAEDTDEGTSSSMYSELDNFAQFESENTLTQEQIEAETISEVEKTQTNCDSAVFLKPDEEH